MTELYSQFISVAEEKLHDYKQKQINFSNAKKYNSLTENAKKQFKNLESGRQRAASIRWKTFESLDKYLIEFEANFNRNGNKLVWAQDDLEAINEILSIINKHEIKTVVKSKTMTAEEIKLDVALSENNIEFTETDLGEFILQISGDSPSHMVTPAVHKSLEDVYDVYKSKLNYQQEKNANEISDYTRGLLRQNFKKADAAITGANFLIADTGSVAITENEGNVLMGLSFPKVHIIIAGIDKIIPSINDLDLFFPLLASYGTGQEITAYNHLISSPLKNGETDGPEHVYLIILDNGRSDLLSKKDQRSAINCIRCGACLTACPVYNNVGGHAYKSVYSGPIGSVILPHKNKNTEQKHLSYASTICGKCTEVCPVKIDLHKLLLYNRRDFHNETATKSEKIIFYFWKKAMLKRDVMNKGGSKTKNFVLQNFFKKGWGKRRTLPSIAPKSFNELWKEMMKS